MTVCALPSSDLQTTPTLRRCRRFDGCSQPRATRADDQHVIGEPLEFVHLKESPVVPNTHRAEAHIEIGKSHPEETRPGPSLVPGIQTAHAIVKFVPHRMLRDLVEGSPHQMPERVTAKYVSTQEHNVHNQNDAADPNPKAIRKKKDSTASYARKPQTM